MNRSPHLTPGVAQPPRAVGATDVGQPVWLFRPPEPLGGSGTGPLAGVGVAVKDNIDVAGWPTTAAFPGRAGVRATRSAPVVDRLLAAGAHVVGKTNMDQFATGLVGTRSPYGACHSVASAHHVSGGSSSGSAVAVASGQVPLALGTDTAGSGRVPAAFNGLVGVKPTRGLVPTSGVLPACRSLDCVTTLTRTVGLARVAVAALTGLDPDDPYSRAAPPVPPAGVAQRAQVVGVPAAALDLDPAHAQAWAAALTHAATLGTVVPVDVAPLLAAARLLYEGPWPAERYRAVGEWVDPPGGEDPDGLDPTVAAIIRAGAAVTGPAVFAGLDALAGYARQAAAVFADVDALLLPTTPTHPTLAAVAADPVGENARLGSFTNFVNLLDLCAVAVPAGSRPDGLPFGVQLIAPAFGDAMLLDLAARWCGEPVPPAVPAPGRLPIVVCGAHLSGMPANPALVRAGGLLLHRDRTAGGYRLVHLDEPEPSRPALVVDGSGPGAVPVEVWSVPTQAVGELLGTVAAPLGLGPVRLASGSTVTGFVAAAPVAGRDISDRGGWRAYRRTT